MKHKFFTSSSSITILTLILIGALWCLTNPGMLFMPSMLHTVLALFCIVFVGLFGIFLFQEQVLDEREQFHRRIAGHMALFVGAVMLVTGIVYQHFQGTVDIWLAFALAGMVTTKLFTRMWLDRYQ